MKFFYNCCDLNLFGYIFSFFHMNQQSIRVTSCQPLAIKVTNATKNLPSKMFTFFLYEIGSPAHFISIKFIFSLAPNFELLQFLSIYKQDSITCRECQINMVLTHNSVNKSIIKLYLSNITQMILI